MKQSRVIQLNKRNLQNTIDRLPKVGCEYMTEIMREILKQGQPNPVVLGKSLSLN